MDKLEIFWENNILFHPEKKADSLKNMMSVAEEWEKENNYFESAITYDWATHHAWGLDDSLLLECYKGAIRNYEKIIGNDESEFETILSFNGIISTLNSASIFSINKIEIKSHITFLQDNYSSYLISHKTNCPEAQFFLVQGFGIRFDMKKNYEYIFDSSSYSKGSKSWSKGQIVQNAKSAFDSMISIPDYKGAEKIITDFEKYFDTHELSGWKFAVFGHNYKDKSDELFHNASVEFAKDTNENFEIERKEGKRTSWSAENVTLWSKYFESRSWLSKAILGKEEFAKCIVEAAESIKDCYSGFVNYHVLRYRVIILFFANVIDNHIGLNATTAFEEYNRNLRITGVEEQDEKILQFFSSFQKIVSEFKENPNIAIVSQNFQEMLGKLDSLSYFSDDVTKLVKPAIGTHMLEIVTGGVNWIYRTIESIADEDLFRKILVRLFQHSFPSFAQNIHSTIEHGKDIIVLTKNQEENTLRMYQAKTGNMNTSEWRLVKPQLEEIFEVEPPDFCKNYTIHKQIGYLIFNGYANTTTIPKMEGWKNLKKEQGLHFEFLNLDGIVQYILKNKLIGELKHGLNEFDIAIVK